MTGKHMEPYLSAATTWLGRSIGIDLGRGGIASTVRRHVEARVRALGDPGVHQFSLLLDAPHSEEARTLVEAATVPHSWLFRDTAQLEAVSDALRARVRGPLSVWVAGCANGEDAVTFTALAASLGHTPSVLATDVNESALERATKGRFDLWKSREVSPSMRRYFVAESTGGLVVAKEIARAITYQRHSLLEPHPRGVEGRGFDMIVCRNVLIYFSREESQRIVERLAERLEPGGLLVLGVSDVLAVLPRSLVPRAGTTRLVLVRRDDPDAPVAHENRAPPMRFEPARYTPRVAAMPIVEPPRAPSSCSHAHVLAALDRGELAVARTLAADLVAHVPDAESQLLEGLALHGLHQREEAVIRFETVCRAAPGCWVAWLHLGLSYERLGRFEAARDALRRVPLASGLGEDLPRGEGELVASLHGSRSTYTRFAIARAASIERGGSP